METSKKFLDENGLTTLWNQIEDNFISTDGIETIISAIDAIKADKELTLEDIKRMSPEEINARWDEISKIGRLK